MRIDYKNEKGKTVWRNVGKPEPKIRYIKTISPTGTIVLTSVPIKDGK